MLRQLFHYSIHCLKQASHEIEIENWKHSRLDLIIFRKANIICFVYIEFFTRSTQGIENFQISRFEYKSTCTQCLNVYPSGDQSSVFSKVTADSSWLDNVLGQSKQGVFSADFEEENNTWVELGDGDNMTLDCRVFLKQEKTVNVYLNTGHLV